MWDGSQCKRIRTFGGHQTRAGVLAWNSRILSSGSRDRNILQHDLRVSNDYVSKLVGHKSEVKLIGLNNATSKRQDYSTSQTLTFSVISHRCVG